MKTLIIAGGSGFLGKVLIDYFKYQVQNIYILSRKEFPKKDNITYLQWDGKTVGDWSTIFEGADVLINLTGKSVDCRYTRRNKQLILSSRIDSTKILGQVIESCTHPPKIWLNSSTATIYRHSLDKEMDETNGELGDGFSVSIVKAWEKQFFSFKLKNTRQVALRTSIVFGKEGGAFVPIKRLTQWGLGGKQGPGNQKVSWIHELDFARSVGFIIKNKEMEGVINIVCPQPTTNKVLMQTIQKKLKMSLALPTPTFLLELGARLINTETELILKSRNVIPTKLIQAGFDFEYETLDKTLTHLLK